MTWANWIPALTSSGALAAGLVILGWLLHVPIQKALEAAISSAFEEKLEGIRSELRREEARLSAELRASAAEIEALRTGALANVAVRQAELSRRRILAVEGIWAEVTSLARYKLLAVYAQSLKMDVIFDRVSKSVSDRKKMAQFATALLGNLADPNAQPYEPTANKERPFIPELAFALFLSYRQILLWPFVQLQVLKMEGDAKLLADPARLVDLARKALPHMGAFLDEHGASGLPYLVEDLEAAVLASLRAALNGQDSDEAALAQAKGIAEAVKATTPKPPPVEPPKLEG
jgi:hypothetical protein